MNLPIFSLQHDFFTEKLLLWDIVRVLKFFAVCCGLLIAYASIPLR
jgi:hypothetical protein